MITAEEVRKEMGINENVSIKTILMNFFQNELANYKDNSTSDKILYGMTDIKVEYILNKYGLTSRLIDADVLKKEVEKFIEEFQKLGFIVNCKKTFANDYSISISWISNFSSEEAYKIPEFIVNKDKDIEEKEDNEND